MPLFRRIRLIAAPTAPVHFLPRRPPPPYTRAFSDKPATPMETPAVGRPEIPLEMNVRIQPTLAPMASLETINSLLPSHARFAGVVSPALLKLATSATDKSTGRSLLHWAAATGQNVLVSNLAAADVDVNTLDRNGNTALHTTVLHCLTAGVATLLAHGAETGIRNDKGWTALHLAAITGNQAIVEQLLSHGADIGIRCGSSVEKTPLHYAVMLSHLSVVRSLVAHGANLAARDGSNRTPAHCAIAIGREGVIALVLQGKTRPVVNDMFCVTVGASNIRSSLDLMFLLDKRDKGFECSVFM